MSLSSKLDLLESKGIYPRSGAVLKRWGQILRETPTISSLLEDLKSREKLVPLHSLGKLHSGVVTRANAFFILRDLPFDQIPRRYGITRRDYSRIAIAMDGLETPQRIERRYLREVIKGPEALLSPSDIESSDQVLFDVNVDRSTLRSEGATGAIAYLRRGETVAYSVSEDSLKGGIPAERSQVKNRKPYWYSLNIPSVTGPRLVLPEHIDRRYIATLVPQTNSSTVIDTLYVFVPTNKGQMDFIWASFNSLLTWFQIELRGRTQHGQGVLKVKIPDYAGILVANPALYNKSSAAQLLREFKKISSARLTDSLEAAVEPERIAFDEYYLRTVGCPEPARTRLVIERELRAAVGERHERKASVVDAKFDRRKVVDVGANIDAYASRIAGSIEPFPDPRSYVSHKAPSKSVIVDGTVLLPISIGRELFNQGEVISGGVCIARAETMDQAQFVRAILMHDPALKEIQVPNGPLLSQALHDWQTACAEWMTRFESVFQTVARAIGNAKTIDAIRKRALRQLHAD